MSCAPYGLGGQVLRLVPFFVEKMINWGILRPPMNASTAPSSSLSLLVSAQRHLYPNYGQPDVIIERGRGARLWDTEGRSYIDLFAGIAVSSLGHAHPRLVQALSDQAGRLLHLSNYYYNAPNIRLAERLCALSGMDRALFCNSGTEAVEVCLKLARRHFYAKGQADRHVVVAFENSFHGRTMGSLAVTGQNKYRDGFGPLGSVRHAPFGDLERTRALMSADVAAVIVEPVQGEGGVIPAPEGFLVGLRALCDEFGAMLILDEVQTGVGRTGPFLAAQHAGVLPDAVALAKGLGAGFPIGAMLCREHLSGALPKGSHGSTYGGNPLASTAALTVLSVLYDDGVLSHANVLSERLVARLEKLVERHAVLSARRGLGMLQGLVLCDGALGPAILTRLRERGVLVTFSGGTTIRLTPPLVISETELDEGLAVLDEVLGEFS